MAAMAWNAVDELMMVGSSCEMREMESHVGCVVFEIRLGSKGLAKEEGLELASYLLLCMYLPLMYVDDVSNPVCTQVATWMVKSGSRLLASVLLLSNRQRSKKLIATMVPDRLTGVQ